MDRITLKTGVNAEAIFQGFCITRDYDSGRQVGKLPTGDNTDKLLGIAAGVPRQNWLVMDGVLDGNGQVTFAEKSVNFEAIAVDLVAVLLPNTPSAEKFTYNAAVPDGAAKTFQIINGKTVDFNDAHATKAVQVLYKPLMSDADKAASFGPGLEGALNVNQSGAQDGTVDVWEPGERMSTFNYDIGATFKDGYAYALSSGKLGDQSGTEIKAGKVIKAPTQDSPDLLIEVMPTDEPLS